MSAETSINAAIQAKKDRLAELQAKRGARSGTGAPPPPPGGGTATTPSKAGAPPPPPARRDDAQALLQDLEKKVGRVTLSTSLGIAQHSIMPQERHTYDKGTQTEFGLALQGKAADMEKELRAAQESLMQREEKCRILMEQLKIDKQKYDQLREDERLQEAKELSPEEQKRVLSSDGFKDFFTRATRIVERALNQSIYDVTTDYTRDSVGRESARGKGLQSATVFQDKRVNSRAVTSIDWSHKYPELLLASYAGQNDPMSLDQHGTVFVWNMHMVNRPEYVFSCNSAVLSAQFHPTQPNLILGACQSGQVVIWDTREKTTPVNRTSLSHGHTHPVYALDSVSVVNRLHNIVSLSTDGHLCIWSDNNLHQPSKEVRMQHGKDDITTTSFAFPKNSQSLVMGSDEGCLYKAHVYDNPGIYDVTQAHKAPITSVRFHPSQKNNNLAEYFLTSSFDWTVKLWSNKINRPLMTFESARDYVFDAQWSPVHPALFAMGDGTGRLDLWNINKESDVPTLTANVNLPNAPEKAAISRVSWSDNGSQIAAGTSGGVVHVYTLPQEETTPSQDESSALLDKLQKKFSE